MEASESLLLALVTIFGAFFLLVLWCWLLILPTQRRWMIPRRSDQKVRCLVVLGSGGHTAEMLYDLESLGKLLNQLQIRYLVAETDRSSQAKAEAFEARHSGAAARVVRVPRAREVGQSYLSSIFTTLRAAWHSLLAVLGEPPDLVVTNGPGTCVPVVFAAHVVRLLCVREVQVIYNESFACVDHLSMSGRLLYHIAGSFTVQWPQLLAKYPKAHYAGRLYPSEQVETARFGRHRLPPAELPALSLSQSSSGPLTAIVTVGSTKFDSLIRAVDSKDFLALLHGMGIQRLKVQKGNGQHWPSNLGGENQPAVAGIDVEIFEYSQDLPTELQQAALVISHAGAGTILDCLLAGRRVVVVPNEELMNNHQVQLGMSLQEQRLLFCFRAGVLMQSLKEADFSSLREFPRANSPVIAQLVCKMLGLRDGKTTSM
uniref:UDP-N-acetylglucosamine transferase subunit ALG14 n=1 Tax=Alexandrium catenella TaxID=2925 RepID=A0A7S1PV83_ALECA|mmetsp:Transcript_112781/g.299614  ORF Transcript_112781/g.299614 Transcript_112781/m.299614 type:complete len:429 (+) Transcript_112781:56-1342(+)